MQHSTHITVFTMKLKSLLGLMSILLTTSAFAQTAEELMARVDNPPPCILSMSRDAGISTYALVREWESLENRFCERMTIGFFESAFQEGKDLPAENLNTKWMPPGEVLQAGQVDTNSLIELNQKAQSLWSEIVACHGSAEKARHAYYSLDNKCGLDKKIRDYSLSVQSFLMTTLPITKNSLINFGFHPLFTELLLENANATSWMPAYDPLPHDGSSYVKQKITEFLVEGHVPEEIVKTDQNSKLNWSYSILKTVQEMGYDLNQLASNTYRHINAIKLLQLNLSQSCEDLGLWPGASRLVVQELESDFSTSKLGIDDITKRYFNACGDFRYTNHTYAGRTRKSLSIVKDFRKLSTRFTAK